MWVRMMRDGLNPSYLTSLSSFSGTAGQAIITMHEAYLFTDSRYWLQAAEEVDDNWTLMRDGAPHAQKDWIEWLVVSFLASNLPL